MRRLVALDLPGGEAFVAAMRAAFDADDAVLPLDVRLSHAARRRLVEVLRPAAVRDESGETLLDESAPVEDGDALVVATSGTTGEPKGVVLTHAALRASAIATSARLRVEPGADTWIACLPLAHVGGLSVIVRALEFATGLEVHDRFEPERVLACAAGGRTLVSLVPTMLKRLGERATAFKKVVLGGSAPPDELADNVVTTYGMTETGSGVVYDGWPLEGVEVRVEDGEILVRGPMLLRAYRDGSSPLTADGWLATGDGGELSPAGRLTVHGRLKDLIVTGGENVWPTAVEALLATAPGVAEVAVGGVPDPEWGERLVAYVVASASDPPPVLEDLRAIVREALGPWAAPKELVLVDELPKTALGKVRRQALRAIGSAQ